MAVSSLDLLAETAPSLKGLLPYAGRAAAGEAPILILGEPGTGRSALARAMHAASPRACGPLIEVDPAVIPSTLFEGEFFGYRAGAFTGAERANPGRLGLAAGGSLVLDHIEELPLPAQPKLLRAVAERRYTPLGGAEAVADVRFIAIGPEDLTRRVERGSFRQDLYYRLEVLAFRLPPLRERRADLPHLIGFFLADLGQRFGTGPLSLSEEARAWMLDHAWPGNLRELRNVLERALVLGGGGRLNPEPQPGGHARPRTLVELEREQILATLAYTRGRQGEAARLLGISRKALWAKRRRLGLP